MLLDAAKEHRAMIDSLKSEEMMSETIHRTSDWSHRKKIARSEDFFEARIFIGFNGGDAAMAERHGGKQLTLQDRLSAWAEKTREQADKMEPGPARNALLKKVEQAQTAVRYEALSRLSGSQPSGDPRKPPK